MAYGLTGLLGVLAVAVAVVVSGPGGLGWWQGRRVGDDERYGPRIWAILREDLGLPAEEPCEGWLRLPESLVADGARIVLRLPWTFRGSEAEKDRVTALINSRVPGEWVGRFSFTGEDPRAVYTRKPPPKPKVPEPEPPAAVGIWDPRVQEILAALGPDEFYCGQDTFDRPVIQKMSDEQAHWALSVGSGGGKSAFLQWLAVQMLMKGGTIIGIDPKMVSLTALIGIQGVHSYVNPEAPQDMRAVLRWVAEVVKARNYEKKNRIRTAFEPLYVFLEECNELADLLKEEYTATKESGAPAGDPIGRDAVAKVLRLGREVNVHIIAVFQDFKDTQFGGVSLVPLFPFKILGSYSERQWKRIIGTSIPMPPIQKKAGRMVLVLDTGDVTRIQTPYVPRDQKLTKDENQQAAYKRLTTYYKEVRDAHGYSTEGLYSTPPAPSPEAAPALLRGRRGTDCHAVTPDAFQAPTRASEGGSSHETAGRLSQDHVFVTAAEPGVTAVCDSQQDPLRPLRGGVNPPAADPTAPPQPLSLSEVARLLDGTPGIPSHAAMRQHKTRRDDFPVPIVVNGKELYLESQIRAYYATEGQRV